MIARYSIALPFVLPVTPTGLRPFTLSGVLPCLVHPPLAVRFPQNTTGFDQSYLDSVTGALSGATSLPVDPTYLVDDEPALLSNLLRLDFSQESFNRLRATEELDPQPEVAFEVANDLIRRVRSITRATWLYELLPDLTTYMVEYLNNDGTQLEPHPDLIRRRWRVGGKIQLMGINDSSWLAVQSLPTPFQTSPWDELLFDATDMLPKVGPALVLAYSALETASEHACALQWTQKGNQENLWAWLQAPNGSRQAPSVEDCLDGLLERLSGHSLKKQKTLWEVFTTLRTARNRYAHTGRATAGGKVVDHLQASQLLVGVSDILRWLENTAHVLPPYPRPSRPPTSSGLLRSMMPRTDA